MEFIPRPTSGNNKAIGHYRHILVAQWLREFRYSTPALIGRLVGIEGPYTAALWRFIQNMKQRNWIQEFSNDLVPGRGRMLMAGKDLSLFLEANGFEHAHVVTNPDYVRRSKTCIHDLAIQQYVLSLIAPLLSPAQGEAARKRAAFLRVDSENQLQLSLGELKPDCLITTADRCVAIEYEMTRKANLRIYHAFTGHLRACQEGRYSGVKYVFPTEKLRATYAELFAAPSWPNTTRRSDGHVMSTGPAFNPDTDLGLPRPRRHYFSFAVAPYLGGR